MTDAAPLFDGLIEPPKFVLHQRVKWVGGDHSILEVEAIELRAVFTIDAQGVSGKTLSVHYNCSRVSDGSPVLSIAQFYLAALVERDV